MKEKKIIFKSNDEVVGESTLSKSFLTPAIDQQTSQIDKAIADTMNNDKLAAIVDNIERFEQRLTDIFSTETSEILYNKNYSAEQQEGVLLIANRAFNERFAKHFIVELPDTDFKVHLFRKFRDEFYNNLHVAFSLFLDKYPKAPLQHISSTAGNYHDIFNKVLEDTFTQIDLSHNPKEENEEKPDSHILGMEQEIEDEDKNRHIHSN